MDKPAGGGGASPPPPATAKTVNGVNAAGDLHYHLDHLEGAFIGKYPVYLKYLLDRYT
jgi:hypothetical protein